MSNIVRLPRIVAIATQPARLQTFEVMLPAIHGQADRVFVYLDGFYTVPGFLTRFDRVVVRRSEALGDLHASSRFLCLQQLDSPAVVAIVDDDILYPPDYLEKMAAILQRWNGGAVVGVHGRIFVPPHMSYVRNAIVFPFFSALKAARHVHELGAGTCAFVSNRLAVDPCGWDRTDMDDIVVALEAQKRKLPRIAIARGDAWLKPLAQNQPDSLWLRAQADDSEQSTRMRALLGLYGEPETGPAVR
jgi:hypothetical protein